MDDLDGFEILGDSTDTSGAEDDFTLFYGWVQKKSQRAIGGWSNRFFLLTSDWKLKYYANEITDDKNEQPRGCIELSMIEGIVYLEGKYDGEGYAFQLIGRHRIYELFVKTHQDLVSWIKNIVALRTNAITQRKDIAVLSSLKFERAYSFEGLPSVRSTTPKPLPTTSVSIPSKAIQQPSQVPAPPPAPVSSIDPRKRSSNGFIQHNAQMTCLLRWVNTRLQNSGTTADSLTCLADGQTIVTLATEITGESPPGVILPATGMREKMQNTSASLRFVAQKYHVDPPQISSHQIISANTTALEDACWELVYMSKVKPISFGGLSDRFALLSWLQHCLRFYATFQIKDFDDSFQDGQAFCALIHAHKPSVLNFPSLDFSSDFKIAHNLRLAFDLMFDHFQVPKLLEARDVMESPDQISIIIYLSHIYDRLNSQ